MKEQDTIMAEMLALIPNDIDTREGSLIYTAMAPVAAQLSEMHYMLGNVADTTIADTARGSDLTRKCAEMGVNREDATHAIRRGVFVTRDDNPAAVPIGSRFSGGGQTYAVQEEISPGVYMLRCEQPGTAGNGYFGSLLPITHISGVATATLAEILVPGAETETDEALRTRYFAAVNAQPFGGNIAQYEQQIMAIPGVGGIKVFPTPNGEGGKVHCVICSTLMGPASSTLIGQVQEAIDPPPSGAGMGLAPIGHQVTISTVQELQIHVTAAIIPSDGVGLPEATIQAEEALAEYLTSISFSQSVVRIARIESILLNLDAVVDVMGTTINGTASNLLLASEYNLYQVPVLGSVVLSEV